MKYSKSALQKKITGDSTASSAGANGLSMPAVSVLQKAAPEEELQMKSVVQKAAPEEELQMKAVVQKAASEEELQMKPVVQKAAPEEELQMKSVVQKAAPEEELQMKSVIQKTAPEEELQMKAVIQKAAPEEEELQMKSVVQKKENKTGMPDQLKSGIENLSGMDMSDVKVHYNSSQPSQLQALAYAQGDNIHIGPGQEKHLPHEAWHVVQQRQGRVKPTMQMKENVAVNDDPGLENEADVMGAKALQMKREISSTGSQHTCFSGNMSSTIQRITEEDSVQAVITFAATATNHGYTQDGLTSIVRHRHAEIGVGNGLNIVLGRGADDRNPYYGRLVYNCQVVGGVHHIYVFHAHGGQTEHANPRGY